MPLIGVGGEDRSGRRGLVEVEQPGGFVDVLVATTREADDQVLVGLEERGEFHRVRDGVRGCMLSVPSAPLWLAAWSQRAVFTTGAALLVLPDGGQLPLPAQSLLPALPPGPLRLLDAQGPAFWIGTDASSTT